jgi:ribonuclease HII
MENKLKKICGVDEVGRGPLAGPVVAAAVVFPENYINQDFKDSKQLSAKKREQLIETIKREALSWSIVAVGHHRIHQLNIREASRLAMSLAVARVKADLILVDGNVPIYTNLPQKTVIGGDAKHVEISAASILAKVYRDQLMVILDRKYPGYGLATHAGYPTAAHRKAIAEIGPSRIHRVTFRGVKEYVKIRRYPSTEEAETASAA